MSPPGAMRSKLKQVDEGADHPAVTEVTSTGIVKVTDFLRQIRGLSSLPGEELESLLYECRFDLLPTLPNNGGAEGKKRVLPFFGQVPSQAELHDLLIGGHVPNGHQRVAHVLYPESVPWPHEGSGLAELRAVEPEEEEERGGAVPTGAQRHRSASPSGSSAGTRRGTGMRTSQNHASLASNSQQENSTTDVEGRSADLSRRSRYTYGASQLSSVADEGERMPEVTVCNQRVKTTVRGRPVHDHADDPVPGDHAEDDERYKAAREKRLGCERAAKLERYHEKKLVERIEYLEELRAAELNHRAAVQKREAARLERNEDLKRALGEDVNRKLEEERATAEEEAERRRKEVEAEQRWKKYHARQKEALDEWSEQKSGDYLSREAQAKMRQMEAQAQKRAREKEKEGQKKTVKQLEVLEKVHRITLSSEERPPLPPRPHDLPRPVLELVESSTERTPRTARGSGSAGWTSQAKAVSSTYGLSEKESAAVKDQLLRGIRGAGRMASYDKTA